MDLYICPSRFLENKLLRASNLYTGKTFTIHNFIEKKPVPITEHTDGPYIVFVGRLSKEKGVELLAQTARLLPQYRFVVAGTGPDDAVLNHIPNVVMAGFLTGQALTNLMANAKLLVAPSVCYENCPLSILEAHSMGVPVVTMNSGGMAELVDDGKTGTLATGADAKSVAQAIERTMSDDSYYAQLKANCETMGEKIMSVKEYSHILVEKYEQLIKQR